MRGCIKIRVVIVTKNIMNELAMQQKLQKLNYEVLCSTSIFEMILKDDYSWSPEFYQVVILSETITNKELEEIVPKLKEKGRPVFRKYLDDLPSGEQKKLAFLAIDHWLSEDTAANDLRELVSKESTPAVAPTPTEEEQKPVRKTLDYILTNFTKSERTLFKLLYKSEDSFVTREDLCMQIWSVQPTDSRLAQVSVLVNSIRKKLLKKGFSPNTVETEWGKGYHLSKAFCASHKDT